MKSRLNLKMAQPNPTAAQRKAAEKWIQPLLGLLNDPALWSLRTDLEASDSVMKTLYIEAVKTEIDARIVTPANFSRRSYEEITNEESSN